MNTKILVADDHQIVREGLRRLIENETDLQVVGEAQTGHLAIDMVGKCLPSVILMDISMPDLNGIEASSKILKEYPNLKIIILSIHSDRRYVHRALKAGVKGYVLKNCFSQELISAIRTVIQGGIYLSPEIQGIVVDDYLSKDAESESRTIATSQLTTREKEILQLLAEGLTTKEIASKINVSTKTVETHRQHIMDKLDIHNIVQLTKYAIREGLTSIE